MKKTFILFIILTMLVFSAYALDSSFDLGVNLSYNTDEEVVDEDVHSGILKQVAVGLEARGNISNLQLTFAGEISVLDTQSLMFSGIFGAGLSVDMFKFFKIGVTTGPKITYLLRDSVQSVDEEGSLVEANSIWNALWTGDFHYRVMVDILAGPVMSIGAAYTIPTKFNFEDHEFASLIPSKEQFQLGQIAICIIMKVF